MPLEQVCDNSDITADAKGIFCEMANPSIKREPTQLAQAVLRFAKTNPEWGQFTVARALSEAGMVVSPSGVRSIWKRYGLETDYKRLLAVKQGRAGRILSTAQLETLKRKRRSNVLKAKADPSESFTEVRREELLLAAARIFSKKGFAAASLREICAIAGIKPTSLYYHFRSKESLFAAVHKIGMQRTNSAIDHAIKDISDPWMRLESACATAMKFILDASDLAVVVRVDPSRRFKPALQRQINHDRSAFEDRFRRIVDDLHLDSKVDRSLFRLSLLGAMNWSSSWYRPGRRSPEEIGLRMITDIFGAARRPIR